MQSFRSFSKKHKVTGIYWVLADVLAVLRSALSLIYLAVLCKAGDVQKSGYTQMLNGKQTVLV